MVDFYAKYDEQFEFYFKSSTWSIFGSSSKTRRRFTQNKKEVHLHYSINGSFTKKAKVFDINDSAVRGMIRARPVPDNIEFQANVIFQVRSDRYYLLLN